MKALDVSWYIFFYMYIYLKDRNHVKESIFFLPYCLFFNWYYYM